MADRKNFLDREKEKRDGENYLPYSIALIPGLTALEQDALVKDIAEGLFKHAGIKNVENGSIDDISNYIDARKKADRLEHAIQRMPEPLRDSWLMSISDEKGVPIFDAGKGLSDPTTAGYYDPEYGQVFMKKYSFLEEPHLAIHEYAHKTNHDLNIHHPYYEKTKSFNVPDRMIGIGLGATVNGELPFIFEPEPKGNLYNTNELIDEMGRIAEQKGPEESSSFFFKSMRPVMESKYNLKGEDFLNKKKLRDKMDFNSRKKEFVADMMSLNPRVKGAEYENNIQAITRVGHNRGYINPIWREASRQKSLLDKFARDRDLKYDYETEYAAMSTEGAAELADLMSTEDGAAYVREKFPETYKKMMEEYKADRRRYLPKENLRPWRLYSQESPQNIYSLRGKPAPYEPNVERRYVRVPDPYGGYKYFDDYDYKARNNAIRQNKNYIEYRGLDGNWRRFVPDEIKHIKEPNLEYKALAKKFGTKLLKGAK